MNEKAKILLWIAISVSLIIGITVYASTNSKDVTAAESEQCTISDPTWCQELIDELWIEHNKLWEQQQILTKKADVYRAIQKLWTWEIETWSFQ